MAKKNAWKRPLYSMPGSSRPVKKPKITFHSYDADGDPVGDEDHKDFLRVLEKYGKEEENEYDYADPQYKMFMENLREDGTSYILEISRGNEVAVRIKYELEDERPCGGKNSETPIEKEEDWRNIAAGVLAKRGKKRLKREDDDKQTLAETKKLAFHSSKDVDHRCRAKRIIRTDHSQFREKLMEILRMPYKQEEYQELLHKITERKPIQSHRDLRGRIKIYDVGRPAKSYLDHHAGLENVIDSVRCDCPKVLNLLRGFFYWLTNLSHQGAFRPWLDSSCLMVVPEDASGVR